MLLLFVLDIVLGIPFGKNYVVDGLGIIAAGLLGYLGWESFKEIS